METNETQATSAFERIQKIAEEWFLIEPLLFSVFCTHKLVQNNSLHVPLRCGKGQIEFSEPCIKVLSAIELEQYLRVETLRILLKHPYQRQPIFAIPEVLTYASNYTICDIVGVSVPLEGVGQWNLEKNLCFEEYYERILEKLSQNQSRTNQSNSKGQTGNSQQSQNKNSEQNKNQDSSQSQSESAEGKSSEKSDGQNSQAEQNGSSDKTGEQGQDSQQNPQTGQDGSSAGNDGKNGQENSNQGGGNSQSGKGQNSGQDSQQSGGQNNGQDNNQSGRQRSGNGADEDEHTQNTRETSELWEEDIEREFKINELIENAESSNNWGTIPGNMKEKILASLRIDVDYRKMLCFYRTSILSSKRHLTRMRPSRRYGFEAMGSRYDLKSNLLVAVDVSGSISTKALQKFYSIINRFFKYGIEKIDVIQVDFELKGKPKPLKKAKTKVDVVGRGGTNFEPAIEYCTKHRNEYDGLIMFTDGDAPIPDLSEFPIEILWMLDSFENYNRFLPHLKSVKKRERCRATYIPLPK